MKPEKIMLTGVSGQIGHALTGALPAVKVIALSRNDVDLLDKSAIQRVVRDIKPDLIIHPAAYTDVDKAESEQELVRAINADAPRVIAEEAAKIGSALIHFSTDYVYDGNKTAPYVETDVENPANIYGKSKLAGEKAIIHVGLPHLILRTSWVYGAYGQNFLKTVLRLAREQEKLNIVADQYGAPTSSLSIAHAICCLVKQWDPQTAEQTGIYHVTNSGNTSWHGFAQEIVKEYIASGEKPKLKVRVSDVLEAASTEYPRAATRPQNSCLDNTKLKKVFGVQLPNWQHGLQEVMQHL